MSNWMTGLLPTMNRTFSLYSMGETTDAGGGVVVSPVLKTAGIVGSIQTLSGSEIAQFGKTLDQADTYFNCLQLLNIANGDLIIDDNSLTYRIVYFEDCNAATGRYFAIIAKKLIGGV
jgi:hypothetical protein